MAFNLRYHKGTLFKFCGSWGESLVQDTAHHVSLPLLLKKKKNIGRFQMNNLHDCKNYYFYVGKSFTKLKLCATKMVDS